MEVRPAFLAAGSGNDATSFGETNWWVISKAGQPESTGAAAARENLCRKYWRPIFSYLRRVGYGPEDSQDLTQSFFACMLEKNYLKTADREKGRFRSFLLVLLKRFLADQRDRTQRQKRGGGKEVISLDAGDTAFRSRLEPAEELTPEKAFGRSWARTLLQYALAHLELEMVAAGRQSEFDQLKPLVTCESQESYAGLAQKLHWSESNVKVTIHRLRRRLADLLRVEIAGTGATPAEVEAEIQDLFAAFN